MTSKTFSASMRTAPASNKNNFDLIRLFAATQVALSHAISHLNVKADWAYLLNFFPGVPIFFFVSGFLIYQSWANIKHDKLRIFFTNRFLRIYPALFLCFIFSVFTVTYTGYFDGGDFEFKKVLPWVISQLTFFQFYNPDFLRRYGVGVLNGSLWTISIELQFYVLTPIVYLLYNRHKRLSVVCFIVFVILNALNTQFNIRESLLEKLISISFVPWVFMFLFGAYASTNKGLQAAILKFNALLLLIIYLAIYHLSVLLGLGSGNGINFFSYVALSTLIVKLAFTKPEMANTLLKKNDISYGIYIYHMPIINFLLFYGVVNSNLSLAVAIISTFAAAFMSWILVERPALHLKAIALRRY